MSEETKTLEDLKDVTGLGSAPDVVESVYTEPRIDALGRTYATGKRKDAVARVWLKRGNGWALLNASQKDASTGEVLHGPAQTRPIFLESIARQIGSIVASLASCTLSIRLGPRTRA